MKRFKQNDPEERKTMFDRCRRRSEWNTAPNSVTQWEGNKDLCSFLQQRSAKKQMGNFVSLRDLSTEARTPHQQVFCHIQWYLGIRPLWNKSNLVYVLFRREKFCLVYDLCLEYDSRARTCMSQNKS
jgi:hypothetical protein